MTGRRAGSSLKRAASGTMHEASSFLCGLVGNGRRGSHVARRASALSPARRTLARRASSLFLPPIVTRQRTCRTRSARMQSKPLIGLNADYRAAKKDAPAFSYVCAGYYDSIVEAGGIPIILAPTADDAD